MSWAVVAKIGQEVYKYNEDSYAAMAETDRIVADLFSQDMSPARQLPVICAYWMIAENDIWYVTHDDISLSEIASTYLPVDRNIENEWNKRWTELWNYQPVEFQFAATNYGLQNNHKKVQSNGMYSGKLPNGLPVRMPQESVYIAALTCNEIQDFNQPESIKIPEILVGNKQLADNIGKKSTVKDSNFWWWALGVTGVLAVGGTGYYFWYRK